MSLPEEKPLTNDFKIPSDEEIKIHIEKLRKLMKADAKVQNLRSDDAYLLRFLHCCNFNIEESFKRLQDYYDLLLEYPEWFASEEPLNHKDLIEQDVRIMIPEKDNDGRPIYICKIGKVNPSKTELIEVVHVDEIWLESILDEQETQLNGLSVIVDLDGVSLKLLKWLTPHNVKVCIKILELYPVKEYRFHVVNTSIFLNLAIKLIWPFLSQRIKDMVKFHLENISSLHEHVSPEVLPPEYGGTNDISYSKCYERLFSINNELTEKLKYYKINRVT